MHGKDPGVRYGGGGEPRDGPVLDARLRGDLGARPDRASGDRPGVPVRGVRRQGRPVPGRAGALPHHPRGGGPAQPRRGTDARSAIRTMLVERVRIAVEHDGRGCLLVNSVCERLPGDPATRRTVRDVQDASQRALADVLRVAAGRVRSRRPPTRRSWRPSWSPFSTACSSPRRSHPTPVPWNPSWRSRSPPSADFFMASICIARSTKCADASEVTDADESAWRPNRQAPQGS